VWKGLGDGHLGPMHRKRDKLPEHSRELSTPSTSGDEQHWRTQFTLARYLDDKVVANFCDCRHLGLLSHIRAGALGGPADGRRRESGIGVATGRIVGARDDLAPQIREAGTQRVG